MCTGMTLATPKGVVCGRTMEFGIELHSQVVVIEKGHRYRGAFEGDSALKHTGLEWESKYKMAGANAFGLPVVIDGLNEKGLYAAVFFFPHYAEYQEASRNPEKRAQQRSQSLGSWQLTTWMLSTCATVQEVVTGLSEIFVSRAKFPNDKIGKELPLHIVVHGKDGRKPFPNRHRCIVVEYVNSVCNIHENKLGVITNAPTFDWHLTNLNNYVNLSPHNKDDNRYGALKMNAMGQGSGMLGLPGDFTPPSRFVRAAFFSQCALRKDRKDPDTAVRSLFHLLNQFDLPAGSTSGEKPNKRGEYEHDVTEWTSVVDLKNLRYYIRPQNNFNTRVLDLGGNRFSGTKGKVHRFPLIQKGQPDIFPMK